MNKLLSATLALTSLSVMQLSALTLYTDKNGQLYANEGEGREKLGEFQEKTTTPKITILKESSPEFLLGKETHINMKFVPEDAPDMWFKAGVRIQGTMESQRVTDNATDASSTSQDAYLRRVRLEVAAGFGKHASFVMDIRNDKANKGVENVENGFAVGDAYVKIKKPFETSLLNFKLYRAKIDVSRTETVKSARVVAYDRPYIADQAAQYISSNRRGTNIQAYGDWNKKVHYQVAFGAATDPSKFKDAMGNKGKSVELDEQSFFYGGKVKISPFDGWEEKTVTETYMGQGQHLTVGASYWVVPTMKGVETQNNALLNLNHKLLNVELSGHYKSFMLQAEYFAFSDVVEDFSAATLNVGTSTGYYVTSEYVLTDLAYLAPFVRYESWDRFKEKDGYDSTSKLAGVNWYLRGNTTKVGLYYQKDELGLNAGNTTTETLRLTSQWFF